jgi:hypothetical protein
LAGSTLPIAHHVHGNLIATVPIVIKAQHRIGQIAARHTTADISYPIGNNGGDNASFAKVLRFGWINYS